MNPTEYVSNFFNLGRIPPFPAIYPELKTAVTVDVLEVGWITAFITGYLSFIILLPGMVGKEKAFYFVRITLTSFIGLVVMLCNFGQEWEIGKIQSKMFYKAGSHEEINGTVGIKLGLRSVNITLYADSASLHGDLKGEKIDYNERFTWVWDQGRAGFGPFAGRIQQEFREAQLKGIPYPILWVAEFFTLDGEGIRFGRHYRHAGWYAHISVWCAVVAWILAIILFKTYIRYGAFMLSLLGCFLLIAALIWCSVRNFIELAVVFNNETSGVLTTVYGIHWYLSLIVGIFCILAGIVIAVIDNFFHNEMCKFFGVDPFLIIDEDYGDAEEQPFPDSSNNIEMQEASNNFRRRSQRTVVYKARGTRKHWKKAVAEPGYDNSEYFNQENNPSVNPNYLEMTFQTRNNQYQAKNAAYPGQGYQNNPAVLLTEETDVATMKDAQGEFGGYTEMEGAYGHDPALMYQQQHKDEQRQLQKQQEKRQQYLQPQSHAYDNSHYMNVTSSPTLPPKPRTKKTH